MRMLFDSVPQSQFSLPSALYLLKGKISKCQHGFLKNRSCLSQLLCSYAFIQEEIGNSCAVDAVYLDFKKAFDSVCHNELLFKLWKLGITGPLWLWFKFIM